MKTALNLLLLVGLLLIPLRVQAQAPLPPGGEAGAQTALYTMRLPVVMQQEPLGQINGQVLEQGQPVAGVKVSLYAFVVGSASEVAVATTEADGTYCFPNVPSLPEEGRLYAVRFSSGEQKRFGNNPSQLWKWETRHIAEFAPGASFTFPPFDIANIELRASTSSRVQSFPIVFTWTPRPQSPRDSYQLVIEDPSTGEEWQSARTLGYTDHYQLEALPTDRDSGTSFQTGKEYLWSIHIYDSVAGGSGYDSHSSWVTFPPTLTGSGQINGHVLEQGQAAAGVKVKLTHYGDYELETLATTTTLEDGTYRFAQVPALPADQKYTVRFENEEDPNRLGFWETKEIVQFSAGETFSYAPFDIGNILLVAPAAQAFPHLPIDFTWTPRAFAPQDSYILDLLYNYATEPLQSYPALQANHYQLDSFPADISGGDRYWWQVSISDTVNGGGGHGFEKRAITLYPYLTGTGQIHGQVREQGQPAAGVTVTLHRSYGDVLAKATTTPDGSYVFTQVPALPEDKFYYVVFKNTSDPTRLGCWYTPDLAQFAAGETHTFAPFDIGNVALLSPAADALLPLPLTFTWTPRSYAPQDRYEFLLISEYHGSLKSDPALQLTDHYDLDAISAESFEPGMIHKWKINIYDSVNGGNGCGFEEREITFPRVLSGSGQINGQVREQGQPAAGVTLDLIFTAPDPYRGSHSGIMARTTTQADGSYSFTHIPELKGTSEYLSNYYVQFYNSDNPNRLRFWELRRIDDFYPGETYTFEPFDIANVELLAPAAGASAAFPLDFTWKARPYAPEDSYELHMEAPSFGYWSNYPPLRFIDHYQHYGLPPGSHRQFGIPVFWQIRIYDYIHGSSGYAFETREVTFLAPTHP